MVKEEKKDITQKIKEKMLVGKDAEMSIVSISDLNKNEKMVILTTSKVVVEIVGNGTAKNKDGEPLAIVNVSKQVEKSKVWVIKADQDKDITKMSEEEIKRSGYLMSGNFAKPIEESIPLGLFVLNWAGEIMPYSDACWENMGRPPI